MWVFFSLKKKGVSLAIFCINVCVEARAYTHTAKNIYADMDQCVEFFCLHATAFLTISVPQLRALPPNSNNNNKNMTYWGKAECETAVLDVLWDFHTPSTAKRTHAKWGGQLCRELLRDNAVHPIACAVHAIYRRAQHERAPVTPLVVPYVRALSYTLEMGLRANAAANTARVLKTPSVPPERGLYCVVALVRERTVARHALLRRTVTSQRPSHLTHEWHQAQLVLEHAADLCRGQQQLSLQALPPAGVARNEENTVTWAAFHTAVIAHRVEMCAALRNDAYQSPAAREQRSRMYGRFLFTALADAGNQPTAQERDHWLYTNPLFIYFAAELTIIIEDSQQQVAPASGQSALRACITDYRWNAGAMSDTQQKRLFYTMQYIYTRLHSLPASKAS